MCAAPEKGERLFPVTQPSMAACCCCCRRRPEMEDNCVSWPPTRVTSEGGARLEIAGPLARPPTCARSSRAHLRVLSSLHQFVGSNQLNSTRVESHPLQFAPLRTTARLLGYICVICAHALEPVGLRRLVGSCFSKTRESVRRQLRGLVSRGSPRNKSGRSWSVSMGPVMGQ